MALVSLIYPEDKVLRANLAAPTGANIVGFKNKYSNKVETVEVALDKLTASVLYGVDYGIVADGFTNCTDQVAAFSLAIKTYPSTVQLRIVLPPGPIVVGKQSLAGANGLGYAYRPTYESVGLRGFLSIDEREGTTILEGYGTTLKLADGMKMGSFDPITGLPSADQITLTPNPDKLATPGNIVALAGNEKIVVVGLQIDGNARGMTLGGRYGDNGWQIVAFGLWVPENITVELNGLLVFDCGSDSLYLTANSTWSPSPFGVQRSALIDSCVFRDSRRQGISITGGQFIVIKGTTIRNIGRYAASAGSFYSGPEACIDIETEGATVQDVVIVDSQLLDGYYTLVSQVVDSNSRRCSVYNTILRNQSTYTSVLNALPDLKFFNCVLEGGGIASSDLVSSQGSYPSLFSCLVSNNVNGATVPGSRLVGKFGVIRDCTFRVQLHTQFNLPTLAVTSEHSNSLASFTNNVLVVYGDKTSTPKNAGGRVLVGTLYGLRGLDLLVTDGTTGTGQCELQISDCTSGPKGVLSNTAGVVDSSGNSIALPDGKWLIPGGNTLLYSQKILPAYTGASLGDDTHRFGSVYLAAGGVHCTSPNGTKYIASVNDLGVWVVTPGT